MRIFKTLCCRAVGLSYSNISHTVNKMTEVVKIYNGLAIEHIALKTANILKAGKIVALPTDTIYGIAAVAQNGVAIQKLYKIKKRNCNKPVAICVGDICDIPKWGKVTFSENLLKELFPGPVTIVIERQPSLNSALNHGVALVGIRIPNDQFIRKVARFCDGPLALTSANVSSQTSTLAIEEFKDIWPHLDLIVDGGTLGHFDPKRLGSTVIDLSVSGFYRIIRPGCALENTVKLLQRHNLQEI